MLLRQFAKGMPGASSAFQDLQDRPADAHDRQSHSASRHCSYSGQCQSWSAHLPLSGLAGCMFASMQAVCIAPVQPANFAALNRPLSDTAHRALQSTMILHETEIDYTYILGSICTPARGQSTFCISAATCSNIV